jgi:hypothetical protein
MTNGSGAAWCRSRFRTADQSLRSCCDFALFGVNYNCDLVTRTLHEVNPMINTLHATVRRRVLSVLASPLLLGSVSAAAPLSRAADADLLYYTEKFYSNATYTVQVGAANGYCDGDYIMKSGYATAYSQIIYRTQCP